MTSISATPSAFDKALASFKGHLTPEEQLDFAQTSIKDVYNEAKIIQERQGQRGSLRNLKKIQPYINGLVQFSGVIEVLVQGKPEIMAFIWGPTKFLLQITSTYISSFDKLLNALEKIGENLPRFEVFSEVFRGDSRMEQVIVMVYEDILRFYQSTLKFFRTKAWRLLFISLWSTFEDKFGGILSSLDQHRVLVDNEATAANIVAAHEDRVRALRAEKEAVRNREMQQLRGLAGWLDPVDYEVYFEGLRHPCTGTGEWLIRNGDFKDWLDGRDITKRLLWLTGIPGSGKTFLSYLAFQHIKSQLRSGDSVAFASPRNEYSTFTKTMRTLVFQLLKQNHHLLPYLNDRQESKAYCPLTLKKEFEEVLEAILGNIGVTYLIIDGLDEIELQERGIMLSVLLPLLSKVQNVKIFLSSRLEVDISDALGQMIHDIYRVDIGANNQTDISTYVSLKGKEVHTKFSLDDAARKEVEVILSRVAGGAKGMFLWARLVISSLLDQYNLSGLELAARNLPDGLDAAYKRILDRINNNLSSSMQALARRVLEWVLCGTRPLRLKELEQAMAIRSGERGTKRSERLLRRLEELCGPILEIDAAEKVHFVHFTAKEYLISTYSGPFIYPSISHRNIASTCISYLSFSCFDTGLSDEQVIENIHSGEYCLHEYAEKSWLHHLRHATKEDDQNLNELVQLLNKFIELQRDTGTPHTTFRSSPENGFPAIRKRWPGLHKHLVDCHTYYSREFDLRGEIAGDPLIIHKSIRQFRKHLENLLISLSSPSDIQSLQRTYGPNLFKCPQPNCEDYFKGFETQKKREEHLQKHSCPFKCNVKTCDFSSIGFSSIRALDNHSRRYHQLSTYTDDLVLAEVDSLESLGNTNLTFMLFDAIATSDRTFVESLLAQDLDINSKNENGETALFCALKTDSEDIIRLLLEKGADSGQKDPAGKPIFCSAIRQGSENLVELLLEWGIATNKEDTLNQALMIGATIPSGELIIKLLLEGGADPNFQGSRQSTALMVAAGSGKEEIVQALLGGGADVNAKDKDGNSALILGASKSLGVTKVLLANGADVHLKGQFGETALMVAAQSGKEEIVQALLGGGADVNAKDKDGNSALILGASKSLGVTKVLLANGADVHLKGWFGGTALMAAVKSGKEEIVQALLGGGADVNAKDKDGDSALIVAVKSGKEEIVQALLGGGADVNVKDKSGDSALILGASKSLGVTKVLLANGADVHLKGQFGETALMVAAQSGKEEIVQALLESGADVNAKDEYGYSALILGASKSLGVTKVLLANGADVHLKGQFRGTALMAAVKSGKEEIVQALLEDGVDVDAKDKNGDSVLIVYAKKGLYISAVKLLLAMGANINCKGSKGRTALMVAAQSKLKRMVGVLLNAGANVDLRDDDGKTALMLARGAAKRALEEFTRLP